MNQILLKKIIEKVHDEKCPIHKEIAAFEIYERGIVIKNFCCSDFYKILTTRIQEEMDLGLYSI
jgi:hypothetical protein